MSDKSIHPAVKAGGAIGILAAASLLVSQFEGNVPVAYLDVGAVPTICYGSTAGVQLGQRASQEECMSRLQRDLKSHIASIQACIHMKVPDPSMAAFASFAYNVGSNAFCGGSVARDLNAGHLALACNDMTKYVLVHRHIVRGLVNRRTAERAYCLKGVPTP